MSNRRKATVDGRIVTFSESSNKGYGLKAYFRRMMADELEAETAKDAWISGCAKADVALRGVVA